MAKESRRVWVVCPDAAAAFRTLGGWEYSDSGLIDWGNLTAPKPEKGTQSADEKLRHDCCLILSEACTILTHRIGQARCTWVSVTNYLPLDLPAWADSVGEEYPPGTDIGPGGASFQSDPSSTADVIDRFFAEMMNRYRDDGGGHWRPTAAQLAHQTWRRSHYTHEILSHDNPAVHALERDALFGGRAEVNFYGTVGSPPGSVFGESSGPEPASYATLDGPLYQFDVRSQYPAILRDKPFPMAFQRMMTKTRVSQLEALARHACVIARVELDTPSPDYPYRIGGELHVRHGGDGKRYGRREERSEKRVCFPVGTFWTSLCGPELLHAIERDRVRRCSVAAFYSAGPAFKSFAEFMIDKRDTARKTDDAPRDSLAKLLANSFVGKFAAKGGGWRTVKGHHPPEPWGEWQEIDAETETVQSWRAISGVSQLWHPTPDEPCGVPSIFAYCTSYGRAQMLEMIERIGRRGWVWCHTDGIVLSELGMSRIGIPDATRAESAGEWRALGTLDRARAWGPSHYFADGLWTLSGWSEGVWLDSRGTIFDWRRDEVGKLIAARGDATTGYSLRRSILSASIPSGAVGPDGWAIAPTLRNGERIPNWIADD